MSIYLSSLSIIFFKRYNLEDSNEFVQRARQQLEEESNYSAPAPVATPAKHSSVKTASASASAAPAPARVKSVQTPPPASAQKKSVGKTRMCVLLLF